jgi:two-component system cell cycle response regulator
VFHRLSVPNSDTAAFRGFSEDEVGLLRTTLLDGKGIDLGAYRKIECITKGPVHQALEEAELAAPPLLCVPIHGKQGEAGVAWIPDDGREFEPAERERALIIASHATAALENAERYNHAKERAFIDDCTEIYNARYLLSTTENEVRRAQRYQNPLSVLFLDLDRFKLVNDRHGHLVGSDTLRALSQVLLQCVRQVDTLARYGGDEFTILLVDTDHDAACAVAERIRRTVEAHVFEAGRGGSLRVTVSIGVATYPQHGESRDTLLESADKAMYRAKSQGRNQIASAKDL